MIKYKYKIFIPFFVFSFCIITLMNKSFAQEARLGFNHNSQGPEIGTSAISFEAVSPPIYSNDRSTGARPIDIKLLAGGMYNLYGRTSFIKTGAIVQMPLFGPTFAELGIGGAIHNGLTGTDSRPGCASMGCRASFWLEAGLGAKISDRWTTMLTLEHISNGRLCERNTGLTLVGLKFSYQF